MAHHDDEYLVVQFCPCGCVYRMKRSEIIAAGAGGQLNDPNKLDAPILPSHRCEQCQDDDRRRNERLAGCMD